MASSKQQMVRFKVIDRELNKRRFVKTRTLQEILLQEFDIKVSTKTISNDIGLMQYDSQLGYFAPIEWDKKRKAWFYESSDYTIQTFALTPEEIQSVSTFTKTLDLYKNSPIFQHFSEALQKMNDAVSIQKSVADKEGVMSFVQVERRSAGKGQEYLPILIEAVEGRKKIDLRYRKYGPEENPTQRRIHPLFLKEYQGRWYLMGIDESKKAIRTFGLDRIEQLEVLKETYSQENSDWSSYFEEVIGITVPDTQTQEISIKLGYTAGQYVRSAPIHNSQEVIESSPDYLILALRLKPNYEFFEAIRKLGPEAEILTPVSLRNDFRNQLKKMLKMYD